MTKQMQIQHAHMVDERGRCLSCGKWLSPFDVMEAGRRLREGGAVRAVSWPEGMQAKHVRGRVVVTQEGKTLRREVTLVTLDEIFGMWEDAPNAGEPTP